MNWLSQANSLPILRQRFGKWVESLHMSDMSPFMLILFVKLCRYHFKWNSKCRRLQQYLGDHHLPHQISNENEWTIKRYRGKVGVGREREITSNIRWGSKDGIGSIHHHYSSASSRVMCHKSIYKSRWYLLNPTSRLDNTITQS